MDNIQSGVDKSVARASKATFLRAVKNAHHRSEILMLELSIYHNIFVTCSSNNIMYLWDYEKGLLIGLIKLAYNDEPTCLKFINGFSMLIVGTSHGVIYFFNFTIKNHQWVDFRLVGYIELNNRTNAKQFYENPDA